MENFTRIVVLGSGKVGRAFIRQARNLRVPLAFTALADRSGFLMGHPLSDEEIENALQIKESGQSLSTMSTIQPLQDINRVYLPGTIVVDTSADRNLDLSPALTFGCKLVFANKNRHSAVWADAKPYFSDAVGYEATVGAGLPVISTLRSLLASGDVITRITGVMSGTLGFLCSLLEDGKTYSEAINLANAAGYTEPDPRDDLSGFDVARKALILARTCGWPHEASSQSVEKLYDEGLARLSAVDFFTYMSRMDRVFSEWVRSASLDGKVLRYVADITAHGSQVGLQRVDERSPLGSLRGPDNYYAIYSQRYQEHPLVIAGPGAGVEVTAAGVLTDVLRFM